MKASITWFGGAPADTIGNAARQHDMQAVLRALSDTLSSCAGCHATFKQQVVAVLPAPPTGTARSMGQRD
jgi:cytochrome c556